LGCKNYFLAAFHTAYFNSAVDNMAIKEDITDKKHSEERIYYLANFDSLTGLPNRVQLEERINYAIGTAKRNNGCFSVMFLDLDYFKEINDTLGHDAGDSLLIELGARFKSVLREIDMVSRVGGDEFIFLFLDTDEQGSSYIAKKLLQVIDSPFKLGDNELLVTASIGIAIYPVNGEDKETLFKNADIAMYRAKQEGRNRYCFYSEVYSS
jgi:diguanylate cyclase (GGDEF)-like protein